MLHSIEMYEGLKLDERVALINSDENYEILNYLSANFF